MQKTMQQGTGETPGARGVGNGAIRLNNIIEMKDAELTALPQDQKDKLLADILAVNEDGGGIVQGQMFA